MKIISAEEFRRRLKELPNEDGALNKIEKQLQKYHAAKNFDNAFLIVEACNEYFREIDKNKINHWNILLKTSTNQFPLNVSSNYPIELNYALTVLELQKQAASILNLKNNLDDHLREVDLTEENLAKIRWNRIKNLVTNPFSTTSRSLRNEYWDEYWMHGSLSLKKWINDQEEFLIELISYEELQRKKPVLGQWNNVDKIYMDDPNHHERSIKNGLMISKNTKENLSSIDFNMIFKNQHIGLNELLLAVSEDDKIYTSHSKEVVGNGYNHSTFFCGRPGKFFGTISADDGKIESISNQTGHYKCTKKNIINLLKFFKTKGIDLNSFSVRLYGIDGSRNASRYLNTNGFTLTDENKLSFSSEYLNLCNAIKDNNIVLVREYFEKERLRKFLSACNDKGKNILHQIIESHEPPLQDKTEMLEFILKNMDKLPRLLHRCWDYQGRDAVAYLAEKNDLKLIEIFFRKYPTLVISDSGKTWRFDGNSVVVTSQTNTNKMY